MSINLDDLKPKPFKIKLKGHELTSQPIRLAHALTMMKLGPVLEAPTDYTNEKLKESANELQALFVELIPELEGIELDITLTSDLIQQLMDNIQPSDNQELKEQGVKVTSDPKVPRSGL